MFTICSYYLDKASVRKGYAHKVKVEGDEIPVETVLPKTRKIRTIRAKIISSAAVLPEPKKKIPPEKNPAKAKPKVVTIIPSLAKKRRKKAGVYVVARKKPVRINPAAQRRKESSLAKAKTKKPAGKIAARKAKRSRKSE
jgi:hypothetical protein